jgi:hypothetical protein
VRFGGISNSIFSQFRTRLSPLFARQNKRKTKNGGKKGGGKQGVDVIVKILCDFFTIFGENIGVFLKNPML